MRGTVSVSDGGSLLFASGSMLDFETALAAGSALSGVVSLLFASGSMLDFETALPAGSAFVVFLDCFDFFTMPGGLYFLLWFYFTQASFSRIYWESDDSEPVNLIQPQTPSGLNLLCPC